MGEIRQSLKIRGMKGEKRVDALFDSGATTNYLRTDIAKMIGAFNLGDVEYEVADGRVLKGYMSSILVFIRNRFSETPVIVTDTQEALILGQTFLQENRIILNFKRDKISFNVNQPKVMRMNRL